MKFVWYADSAELGSPDTIHQILAYGGIDDILKLREKLGVKKLQDAFLSKPKKIYNHESFYFIKRFILNIHIPIDEHKYLKSSPRRIG